MVDFIRRPSDVETLNTTSNVRLAEHVRMWSSRLHLTAEKQYNEEINAQVKSDRVGAFWALLLLSAQSKVELSQEEFYQEIKIRTISSYSQEQKVLEARLT